MNVAVFIAKRIAFNRQKSFSRFIIRLATAATAISMAAMIITICFVSGFQDAISNKVFSFWGHLRVQQYEPNKALVAEESPILPNDTVLQILRQTPQVQQVQAFTTKSAVIEKNKEIDGVLIKGVDEHYDFQNLQPYLKSGKWINFRNPLYSRDIVVSKQMADELKINLNDSIMVYFIQNEQGKTLARKLHVSGIYKTGIEEYDKLFVLADIRLIRQINEWHNGEIGGYEVFLKDYHAMDSVSNKLYDQLPGSWISRTVREIYPSIFDWLNIQDVNRNVIFVVMSIVAIINLITCLLILVLERTKMTGILKSMGGNNGLVQRIFLYYASLIALKGIVIGFIVGVGFCLLQQHFGFIKLNETSYYISEAPVTMKWGEIGIVTIATFIVCYLALLLPTLFVRSIKPVKAIGFN